VVGCAAVNALLALAALFLESTIARADERYAKAVLSEPDTSVGTVCVYEATSPEAIRAHADAADLPVDEIVAVSDTIVVRPDPAPVGV
jgi:hypothetical protein